MHICDFANELLNSYGDLKKYEPPGGPAVHRGEYKYYIRGVSRYLRDSAYSIDYSTPRIKKQYKIVLKYHKRSAYFLCIFAILLL